MPPCPIPEITRLRRTLKQWRDAFLAYSDTRRSSNGGTEAVNGLIELHRRMARGFSNRENFRLRMLLIAGGLISPTSSTKSPLKRALRGVDFGADPTGLTDVNGTSNLKFAAPTEPSFRPTK